MRQRLPYYCIGALFVIAGHLEAQGLRWFAVADAMVIVLLLGIVAIAVVEFLVFEREQILRSLDQIAEEPVAEVPVPESPGEITLVLPVCRDDEPQTVVIEVLPAEPVEEPHPMFAEVHAGFASAAADVAAQAGEAMAAVESVASGQAVRKQGVA